MVTRFLTKVTLIGSGITGGVVLAGSHYDLSSLGVVRFGRAAVTAMRIAVDYKILFHRYDNSHPEYAEAIHSLHLASAT